MNYITDHKTTFKYIISYILEHNSIVKCCWRTLHTMKNFMLLNAKLFNWFWTKIINTVNYLRNWLLIYNRTIIFKKVWTEQRSSLSYIRIFEFLLYIYISKKKQIKLDLNWMWKDILIKYMTINKQIKVWSVRTNLIHIVLIYTIDECSRDADLLENEYILLSLLTYTKLYDWMTLNTLCKCS